MKYLIENITDKIGHTRTDDLYPNRIGSIADFQGCPKVGHSLWFSYTKYKNNECVHSGITATSEVTYVDENRMPGYVIVYTINSVFYFKKLHTT